MANASNKRDTEGRVRRRANVVDICRISIDRRSPHSLQSQVSESIRKAILTGILAPATLLPSSRLLAEDLKVSRNVVMAAYEGLVAEGLLVTALGSGTRVTDAFPSEFAAATRAHLTDGAYAKFGPRPLSRTAKGVASYSQGRYVEEPRPFVAGLPGIDQFPIASWTALVAKNWRDATVSDLCRMSIGGGEELRSSVSNHVVASRGAVCSSEQVLIISGTQQGLDIAARALADPGDICWIEEPGYLNARQTFAMAGLQLVPAPVDDYGLDVDRAIATLPPPRIIYVTPSHQFPIGGTLPLERRIALLQYADRVGAWIIEDDYDSEFSAEGAAVPCLQGLDPSGRVVYIASFNKTMFPGIRLGFAIVPVDLIPSFKRILTYSDGQPSAVMQKVLGQFINQGKYFSHIRRMRSLYAQRREKLVESIRKHLPYLTTGICDRGLHLVAFIPPGSDDIAWAMKAQEGGISLKPLGSHFMSEARQSGLVFGFACVSLAEIEPALLRLKTIFEPLNVISQ